MTLEQRATELGLAIKEILRQFQSVHALVASGPHSQLSHQELFLVEYLGESGPSMMRTAAEYVQVAVNSLTAIVDNLEQKGIVQRVRSSVDRRVVHIELTKLGRECYQSAATAKKRFHCELLSTLSSVEQRTLLELFRKIATAKVQATDILSEKPTKKKQRLKPKA